MKLFIIVFCVLFEETFSSPGKLISIRNPVKISRQVDPQLPVQVKGGYPIVAPQGRIESEGERDEKEKSTSNESSSSSSEEDKINSLPEELVVDNFTSGEFAFRKYPVVKELTNPITKIRFYPVERNSGYGLIRRPGPVVGRMQYPVEVQEPAPRPPVPVVKPVLNYPDEMSELSGYSTEHVIVIQKPHKVERAYPVEPPVPEPPVPLYPIEPPEPPPIYLIKPPVYPVRPPVYRPINPPVYPPIKPPVYPPIKPPVYPTEPPAPPPVYPTEPPAPPPVYPTEPPAPPPVYPTEPPAPPPVYPTEPPAPPPVYPTEPPAPPIKPPVYPTEPPAPPPVYPTEPPAPPVYPIEPPAPPIKPAVYPIEPPVYPIEPIQPIEPTYPEPFDGNEIPGEAGTDYPNYIQIPPTNFKCSDVQYPGYYGIVEARCQVFVICQADGRQDSFLCPVGTLFQQKYFVCDWWYNVNCEESPNYYYLNQEIGKVTEHKEKPSYNYY